MVNQRVQPGTPAVQPAYCGFCSLQLSDPSAWIIEDSTTVYCSSTCRDADTRGEARFADLPAFKLTTTGVAPIDAELPYGYPRNSAVLLAGEEGALDAALPAELVWRTLTRGEPAVFVTFNDTPFSVIEQFLLLDWNVLPFLERDRLAIIDCFSTHDEPTAFVDSPRCAWVKHVERFAKGSTRTLRDPTDVQEIATRLVTALEDRAMYNTGCIVIDSLTEFATTVPPVHAHNFLKDIRAQACKTHFVPLFAGATISEEDTFPLDMTHVVDGRIDMRLAERGDERRLYKELCVRKMDSVPSTTNWRHV